MSQSFRMVRVPDTQRVPLASLVDEEVARSIDSLPNRVNEMGFDQWGFSPAHAKLAYSLAKRFVATYFRPEVRGIENIPAGRVLLVANHSGQLPFDGLVAACTTLVHAKPPRLVRPMAERWFPRLPYINTVMWRAGAVLGDPINCRNLLMDDQAILVFPEGIKGSGKTWFERYQLQPMGRGFMRLALQTGAPIVPLCIIGGEESIISVYNWKGLARVLGFPYFPVSPLLPVLGLFSFLPMPVRFYLRFGNPMHFEGPFDDEDAAIDRKVAAVRAELARMIKEGLAERRSVF